jgi:mono/diheme cytochrome c family protein
MAALAAGFALVAAGTTGSLIERAAARRSTETNPLAGSEEARRAGAKLYARECASCHGANREGGTKAPPLVRPEVLEAAPGTLFWILRNGSLRRGMPSFAHLPEPTRWQIVTFLQTGGVDGTMR